MLDAGNRKTISELHELALAVDGKNDGVCVLGEIAATGLAGGVDKLRREIPEWEISADHTVVIERLPLIYGRNPVSPRTGGGEDSIVLARE